MSAPEAGADYSTKALHFAVVQGDRLIDAWAEPLPFDLPNRLVVMVRAIRRMKERGANRLSLEQPFFAGAGKAVSNNNTLALHRVAFHLEAVAASQGLDVAFIAPSSWRMVVLGNGRPKDPKAEAVWYADAAFKYKTTNHNQADAICLAAYGAALQRSRIPTTSGGRRGR